MATIKSEYYRFNGVSWDIHYFKTTTDMVDGLNGYIGFGSHSDFPNGTLVITDIEATNPEGASWTIEVKGKGYGLTPIFFIAEGYNYYNTFIQTAGYNYGANIQWIKVLNYGGVLAFWWPRLGYWNSFDVTVKDTGNKLSRVNRVVDIIDSTEPESTKKVQIDLVQNINAANIYSQRVANADTVADVPITYIVKGSNTTKSTNIADVNAMLPSGFYETLTASNVPASVAGAWNHLLTTRHTNESNNFQMQFLGNFNNPAELHYRVTAGDPANAQWYKVWNTANLPAPVKKTINTGNYADLDFLVESGFYRIEQYVLNAPVDASYSQLIVSRGDDTILQILSIYNTGDVYTRTGWGIGFTQNWTPWQKVWTTGNFNPSDYMPKSGGTFTGPVSFTGLTSFEILHIDTMYVKSITSDGGSISFGGVDNINFGYIDLVGIRGLYSETDAFQLSDENIPTLRCGPTGTGTFEVYGSIWTDGDITSKSRKVVTEGPTAAKTANYTFVLGDANGFIYSNSTSALTFTIPTNASAAFPIGTEIHVMRYGSGELSIAPASGVSLVSEGGKRRINAQYQAATLKKINTDNWVLIGAIKS